MRLRLDRIRQAAETIDPVFLHSPQFFSEALGDTLGVTLTVKIETLNPVRSFKGRGADFLVRNLPDRDPIVCASAGNFGQAMAYACRSRRIPLIVYAGTSANHLKISRMQALGADVRIAGADFDAAKLHARRAASESGFRFIEDGLAIETGEGAGTIGLELAPARCDFLLVPLGNGALFSGVALAIKTLSPSTQVIAVQAAGAPAMAESLASNTIVVHEKMDTIADGIGVRVPIPEALDDVREVCDDCVLVQENSILTAMRLIHRHCGIVVEPSAAVGIAAILEDPGRFAARHVGVILCGGNITPEQIRNWLQLG